LRKKRTQLIKPEDLRLVIKQVIKNWLFIITIPPLAALLGYYNSYKLANVYQVKTEIQLKSEQHSFRTEIFSSYGSYYDSFTKQTNQERILKSYDLISEVVTRCNLDISYFNVGRIRTTDIYKGSPFRFEPIRFPDELYERAIDLFFEPDGFVLEFDFGGKRRRIKFDYNSRHNIAEMAFKIVPTNGGKLSQLSFLTDTHYQFIIHDHNNVVTKYREGLQVTSIDNSTAITMSVEDVVEGRAIDFLDTLNNCYRTFSVKERLLLNGKTIDYIDEQLRQSLIVMNNVESELEGFKAKESIFNLNKEETIYYEQLVRYEEEQKKLELELKTIHQLEAYIAQSKEGYLLPPSFYVPSGDSYLTKTLEELYQMQNRKNSSLYDLKDNNPMVQRTDRSFELIKKDMLAYLLNTKQAITLKIEDYRKTIKQYEQSLRAVPKAQREIINIERRIAVNEKLYNYLLEQRANVIIERSTIAPESEVIEQPRSLGVIRPNRKNIRNYYILTGFGLIIGIFFIRFFFLDKYETPSDIKAVSEVPVIGGIPFVKKFPDFNSKEYASSDLADGVRRIRTNLQFMGASLDKKIILVTSMFPSEGKTFTSVNLAYMNALANKRVLLIDFDMHKPNVHKTMKIGNSEGLSLLLIDSNMKIEDVMISVNPMLDVITAGPVPPNASELVMLSRVNEMIESFRDLYDIIILDTPPLHLITDARILMSISEINLVIMNVKNATRNNLADIEELYEEGVAKNFGLVLNGVTMSKLAYLYSKYDYKYAYKYGYAYGYGYGYKYGKDI